MNAATEFDLGPLTWVKGEIDLALGRADEALEECRLSGDSGRLKFCRTHVHQVHGALSIVGLDGASQLTESVEALLLALEEGRLALTSAAADAVSRSLAALRRYLDDLIAGEPNQPLRLLPEYRALAEARGVAGFSPSDLFHPDLVRRPPRRPVPEPLSADAQRNLIKGERARFQKGLLSWLTRSGDVAAAIGQMRSALGAIEAVQESGTARTFWWSALAFIDSLAGRDASGDNTLRHLLARVDTQIRRLQEGSRNVAERLLRDILYEVGRVPAETSPAVAEVQELFSLRDLIPPDVAATSAPQEIALRRLREALVTTEESWNKVCSGSLAVLPAFAQQAQACAGLINETGQLDFKRLGQGFAAIASWLAEDTSRQNESIAMEVATAILLMQNAQENFRRLGTDFAQQVDLMVARLHGCIGGRPPAGGDELPLLDEMTRRAQEKLLVGQVAREIKSNLGQVEQALDAFFRNPEKAGELVTLEVPLKQTAGALAMLGHLGAVTTLQECGESVRRFAAPGYTPAQDDFETVAHRLSVLGFFVDSLEHGESDYEAFVRRIDGDGEEAVAESVEEDDVEAAPSVEIQVEQARQETQALVDALREAPEDGRLRDELKQNLQSLQKDADLVADQALGETAKNMLGALESGDFLDSAFADMPQLVAAPVPEAPAPASETMELAQSSHEEIDAELLEIFLEEAHEVLENLGEHVEVLKADARNVEALTTIRRAAHTLKGSGRMVGLVDLGEAAWELEQTLNFWLREDRPADPELLALIESARALFVAWVTALESGGAGLPDPHHMVAAAARLRGETVEETAPAPSEVVTVALSATDVAEPVAVVVDFPDFAAAPGEPAAAVAGDESFSFDPGEPEIAPPPAPAADAGVPGEFAAVSSPDDEMVFDLGEPEAELAVEAVADAPVAEPVPADALPDEVMVFDLGEPEAELAAEVLADAPAAELAPADVLPEEPSDAAMVFDLGEVDVVDFAGQEYAPAAPTAEAVEDTLAGGDDFAFDLGDEIVIEEVAAGVDDLDAVAPESAPAVEVPPAVLASPTLYDIFCEEARGHLATLLESYAAMDANPTAPTSMPMIRAAHTLGGIAATVGLMPLHHLAIALEHALMRRDNSRRPDSVEGLETARQAILTLQAMFEGLARQEAPEDQVQLIAALEDVFCATTDEPAAPVEGETVTVDAGIEAYFGDSEPAAAAETSVDQTLEPAAGDAVLAQAPAPVAPAPVAAPRQLVDDYDEQLLPIFLDEAQDQLAALSEQLHAWRSNPADEAVPRAIARVLHTFKGNARMAGAMNLGEYTHLLESRVEEAVKGGSVSQEFIDEVEAACDTLDQATDRLRHGETAAVDLQQPAPAAVSAPALPAAPASGAGAAPAPAAAPVVAAPAEAEHDHEGEGGDRRALLRVRADLVDRLVNEAGEMSIARARIEGEMRSLKGSLLDLTENVIRLRRQLRDIEIQAEGQIQARVAQSHDGTADFDPLELDRFTRFQELTRFMAESVNDVATVQQNLLKNLDDANAALIAQARLNRGLQQALMGVRMVPFSSQSERLFRIVRQAAKELGKRANLELVGGHVEMDRSVLEKMMAPIEHMLRNAVAHGIEPRDDRIATGKREIGEVSLKLSQEGNEIIVAMSDDGRGLDPAKLRARGEALGLVAPDEAADDAKLYDLIFRPGFSTAGTVSQIAGRGVGMDVVRTGVADLGGRIEIASELGKGTTFRLYLPLTLAVTQTLILRAGASSYAIPAAMIEQVLELKAGPLEEVRARGEVSWQNNRYPFRYLPHLVGELHAQPEPQRQHWVLLLRSGSQRVAVQVDELRGNQEVVIKNIGAQLAKVVGIAGATVLGDGQVTLILNPVALASRAPVLGAAAVETGVPAVPEVAPAAPAMPTVMVVDDSLTVRKITSRMLTREGFQVVLAKDGVDALEQLLDVTPDVILSDIEMPRMDGFDFVRNVRADSRLAKIPVIMITSRTAEKHRTYAIEIGASAYLGKPYDEDQLLGLIRGFVTAKAS
ncbi:MAG: response regulator [Betaproteobacteria bacterium]|nr:response regulator [Betaproteobacteria bacterium]